MAYQTLAENIVAALILAAHGDLTVSLSDSIRRVEAWQRDNDCHFGTERSDIGMSLRLLRFFDEQFDDMAERTLAEAIPALLTYKHWSSSDEGAYWDAATPRRVEGTPTEIRSTSFRTHELQQYLTCSEHRDPDRIVYLLRRLGLHEDHLFACARPGASS